MLPLYSGTLKLCLGTGNDQDLGLLYLDITLSGQKLGGGMNKF